LDIATLQSPFTADSTRNHEREQKYIPTKFSLEIVEGKLGIPRSRWEESMTLVFMKTWYDVKD
jgi:hypothetical protein